jgi:hypothetical protein
MLIGFTLLKGFNHSKQLRITDRLGRDEFNLILSYCKVLERLDIISDTFSFYYLNGRPLKSLFLQGHLPCGPIDLEILFIHKSSHFRFSEDGKSITDLTTLKIHSCWGITNDGFVNIADYCVNLMHFEIGDCVDEVNLSDGVK